jgi:hypothetical protein
LYEQRQPFCRNFRVGQNIFYRGQLSFWQEKRVWLPVEHAFVKQFLRMNAATEDPNRGIDILSIIGCEPMPQACDHGCEKRLRRLDHMRKLHRPLRPLYRMEFSRDWFARRDAFDELCANRFFH